MLDRAALQDSPALAESLLPYFKDTSSPKYLSKSFSKAFQFGHMDVAIPISVAALRFESNSIFDAAFKGDADIVRVAEPDGYAGAIYADASMVRAGEEPTPSQTGWVKRDHVRKQGGDNIAAASLRGGSVVRTAGDPLLFPGEKDEVQRAGELILAQNLRRHEDRC